jgi:hypothetical protein
MPTEAPVAPIQSPRLRPVVMRTPYGWDCKMVEEYGHPGMAIGVPDPEPAKSRPPLVTLLIAGGVALALALFGATRLGHSDPAAPARAPLPTAAPSTIGGLPSVGTDPSATAAPSEAPITAAPSAAAPPPGPSAGSRHINVTGAYVAGANSQTTCNSGRSGRGWCQWEVAVPAGSSLGATLQWNVPAGMSLKLTDKGGHVLAAADSTTGTVAATATHLPTSVLIITTVNSGTQVNFSVDLSLSS